ncbi:MAG: selenide, water dikinase, partial [Armatimonadetes bacterium]|nr:selenide, water dikinase [Armatimonadota bacterium]
MLRQLPKQVSDKILVGLETSDDAGVYILDQDRALIQTLDFFTPIVDDPYEYGQIAAANSLSDVYAMGGTPLTAMNIVCFPMADKPKEWLVEILRGGADKVAESGALLLGGHTVNDETIKYGLSVTGIARPEEITANSGARPGDCLVLTKAIGTGLVTTALKRGCADAADVAAASTSMKTLNAAAQRAMVRVGARAATDITGFGLLGHLYEVAAASGVSVQVDSGAVPFLPGALRYAEDGVNTGGGRNNAAYLGERVRFTAEVPEPVRVACFDPQTSGGLLIAVPAARVSELLVELLREGVPVTAKIGHA